jgi:hypothetical protein
MMTSFNHLQAAADKFKLHYLQQQLQSPVPQRLLQQKQLKCGTQSAVDFRAVPECDVSRYFPPQTTAKGLGNEGCAFRVVVVDTSENDSEDAAEQCDSQGVFSRGGSQLDLELGTSGTPCRTSGASSSSCTCSSGPSTATTAELEHTPMYEEDQPQHCDNQAAGSGAEGGSAGVTLNSSSSRHGSNSCPVGWWQQYRALVWREAIKVTRNPADVAGRILTFAWVALLVGLIYYNMPTDASSIRQRLNVLFSTLCFFVLMPFINISIYTEDKGMYLADVASKLYKPSAYYLAKVRVISVSDADTNTMTNDDSEYKIEIFKSACNHRTV